MISYLKDFERYVHFDELKNDVKKIRIKNVNSTRIQLKEIAFYGESKTTIGMEPVDYVKNIAIPAGVVLASNDPTKYNNTKKISFPSTYTTKTKKAFGLLEGSGQYEWVLVKLQSGEEIWISTTKNDVVIKKIFEEGIIDTVSGSVTNYYGVSYYNLYLLTNNSISTSSNLYMNTNQFVTFTFNNSSPVKAIYLKKGEYVDDMAGKITIQFFDESGNTIYLHQVTRKDLYQQYFMLPQTIDGVKSIKIMNTGVRAALSEMEFY